ncbi:MAG: insulinase family protein [Chlamydiales bacterium]
MNISPPFPVGTQIDGFTVIKSVQIEELCCLLTELTHEKTGAQVMHIGNEDPENVFCLSFTTLPDSSDGVAHILEHTVLCGSKKYPIHDPFFSMQRRSLNTFMNAFTGSDFTCYTASSQNKKDYFNLLDVFLDAVFYPTLDRLSFLQEGWRLEFDQPDNPDSPLEYKGIVYNEMKGALSSPNARLGEMINRHLYPDLTYGYNSGGDPLDIPNLTYERLLDFHKTFYHPGRCLFYFYGDIPLEENLRFISEQTLNHVTLVDRIPYLPRQPRYSTPRVVIGKYPVPLGEATERKTVIAFGWLTCHVLDEDQILALSLIDIILMGTDASPLKKAFLRSGLCYQASAYLESDVSEIPVIFTLKGCEPSFVDQLRELLFATLKDIVKKGVDSQDLESAMHQLELHRSEITGDGTPFGLSLFMRSALVKQHGGNPEDALKIHELFAEMRKNLENDPQYLESLIQKHFIDNPHFVTLVLRPESNLGVEEAQQEKDLLERVKQSLSEKQIISLVEQATELQLHQEQQNYEDIEMLPKVTAADIPQEPREYKIEKETFESIEIFRHECFTNEIVYTDLIFPFPQLAEEELPYVQLFALVMPQMGCGGRDYAANLDFMIAHTGGVGVGLAEYVQAEDFQKVNPCLAIKGKALYRKSEHLFSLMYDMAMTVDFLDKERLKEIIAKTFSSMQHSINSSALKYASNLAASGISLASKIKYQCFGLPFFWLMRDLAENFDQIADTIIEKLLYLKEIFLCTEGAHLLIGCSDKHYQKIQKNRFYGIEKLPQKPIKKWDGQKMSLASIPNQGRIISSPVAFTNTSLGTVPYVHPDAPALMIASSLMENLVLHTRIREQGGAYGGGASFNPLNGIFSFYAYRDPNLTATLKAFKDSVQMIAEGKFDDSDLEEAILATVQGMDTPLSPGSRAEAGYALIRENRDHEKRKAFRTGLLNLTKEQISYAAKTHLFDYFEDATTVSFAGKSLLEHEIALMSQEGLPSWNVHSVYDR